MLTVISMKITHITARQILDSRGNPTVEADVLLEDGSVGRASVPSGASTGSFEAHELRDHNTDHYQGKGVLHAVRNVRTIIAKKLISMDALDQNNIDQTLIELDGSTNKSILGANAILAVSLAVCKAAAASKNVELWQHVNELAEKPAACLPIPMMNVINGGRHTTNGADIQEYMVVPARPDSIAHAIELGSSIFHALQDALVDIGQATSVGDEGGYAMHVQSNEQPLELLAQTCTTLKLHLGSDVQLALDVAASELYFNPTYELKSEHKKLTAEQLSRWYKKIIKHYAIASIEDPFAEEDWSSWTAFTASTKNLRIVGDDLLTTNVTRIQKAIDTSACNTALIKPNQIGTLTETIAAVKAAHDAGWTTIMSHRSGETEDTVIAHLAVGLGCKFIKSGSPCRGERTAKYNELLRIEEANPELQFME